MKWINAEQRVTVSIYDDEHEEYLDKIMTVEDMLDAYTNEGCPTIYSNPEQTSWIPVSEKLPEPLTAVLLTVRYKSSGCLTYQMGYWEDTLEKWEKWLEIGTLDDEFEILAWMELPEGYEEDSYE